MKITLKDIAKESGYSVTTVSRALGGYDDVNEQTRSHIIAIANALGYHPNLIARQLQSQRTYTIGMVIPTKARCAEDDYFSTLLKGVMQVAAENQYDVLVSAQLPENDEMDAYRKIVGGNRVDGVIVTRTYRHDARIAYLEQVGHPFVVAGRLSPDEESTFPYIDMDSQAGIQLMVAHLVKQGRHHIGLLLSPDELAFTPYRLAGYREGLAAAGLPYRPAYVAQADLNRDGGQQAAGQLLDATPSLTALIACNDLMAIGAMQAVQERGLQVGGDIAIGGFDDIPVARHTIPALTTIRQPICEIGEQLTRMLLRLINQEPLEQPGVVLEPTLMIRASSGSTENTKGKEPV